MMLHFQLWAGSNTVKTIAVTVVLLLGLTVAASAHLRRDTAKGGYWGGHWCANVDHCKARWGH
jgi:hypothetical protein